MFVCEFSFREVFPVVKRSRRVFHPKIDPQRPDPALLPPDCDKKKAARCSPGGLKPNAVAGGPSVTRFTHRRCMAVRS